MKILTLNCGSSSVKYSLWEVEENTNLKKELCNGIVERIGLENSYVRHKIPKKDEAKLSVDCKTHEEAIKLVFDLLEDKERGVVKSLEEINAVGHRVVHGGEKFRCSTIVNEEVIKAIEELSPLAPLHNPANVSGIKAAMKMLPDIPHVAVFDTAFYTELPPYVYLYALPYEWYEKYGVRKYGFHGTSHRYVAKRAAALLNKELSDVNLITLHIGNGVSVTAIKKGVAYEHSMGFTPLEGAIMGTRCGDVDPGAVLFVMKQENLTPDYMNEILNKKSGLLGITGKYVDRRDILKAAEKGEERAELAIKMEVHRLKKFIGAYAAVMGGVDAIAFTAGVGENSPFYRRKICENLDFLGIKLDHEKNEVAVGGREMEISTSDSPVKVFVIPTNEELIFVEETIEVLNKLKTNKS